MDELIDTEMGLVEVEQSDIDAATQHADPVLHPVWHDLLKLDFARHRIAEREACAKVCDEVAGVVDGEDIIGLAAGADVCAQSIRNRTPCTPPPTGVD